MNQSEISEVIEMAWQDDTPFEAIKKEYNLSEPQVINLMRAQLKHSSFKMWRKRVTGRKTKHSNKSSNSKNTRCHINSILD